LHYITLNSIHTTQSLKVEVGVTTDHCPDLSLCSSQPLRTCSYCIDGSVFRVIRRVVRTRILQLYTQQHLDIVSTPGLRYGACIRSQ